MVVAEAHRVGVAERPRAHLGRGPDARCRGAAQPSVGLVGRQVDDALQGRGDRGIARRRCASGVVDAHAAATPTRAPAARTSRRGGDPQPALRRPRAGRRVAVGGDQPPLRANASLPVTFCSRIAGTSASTTRRVRGTRQCGRRRTPRRARRGRDEAADGSSSAPSSGGQPVEDPVRARSPGQPPAPRRTRTRADREGRRPAGRAPALPHRAVVVPDVASGRRLRAATSRAPRRPGTASGAARPARGSARRPLAGGCAWVDRHRSSVGAPDRQRGAASLATNGAMLLTDLVRGLRRDGGHPVPARPRPRSSPGCSGRPDPTRSRWSRRTSPALLASGVPAWAGAACETLPPRRWTRRWTVLEVDAALEEISRRRRRRVARPARAALVGTLFGRGDRREQRLPQGPGVREPAAGRAEDSVLLDGDRARPRAVPARRRTPGRDVHPDSRRGRRRRARAAVATRSRRSAWSRAARCARCWPRRRPTWPRRWRKAGTAPRGGGPQARRHPGPGAPGRPRACASTPAASTTSPTGCPRWSRRSPALAVETARAGRRGDRAAARRAAAAVPGDRARAPGAASTSPRCASEVPLTSPSSTCCTSTATDLVDAPARERLGCSPQTRARRTCWCRALVTDARPRRRRRSSTTPWPPATRGSWSRSLESGYEAGRRGRRLGQGQAPAHPRPGRARRRVGQRPPPGLAVQHPPRGPRPRRPAGSSCWARPSRG